MSIIVAINRNDAVTMASDSLTCFGEGEQTPPDNCRTRKIIPLGDGFLGGTGWAVYDDIIEHWISNRTVPPLTTRKEVFAFFLDLWRGMRDGYPFVNDQANSKDTPFTDLDSSFLIGSPGGIFKVSSDLGVTAFQQYAAIGSGAEYALGALDALWNRVTDDEELVRAAVDAACTLDVHCGGITDVFRVALAEAPAATLAADGPDHGRPNPTALP